MLVIGSGGLNDARTWPQPNQRSEMPEKGIEKCRGKGPQKRLSHKGKSFVHEPEQIALECCLSLAKGQRMA